MNATRQLCIVASLIWLLYACKSDGGSAMSCRALKCELAENPISVVAQAPRLSWQLYAEQRNQSMSAYRILVASSASLLKQEVGDLWDSKKVISEESLHVPYKGAQLSPHQKCYWKVMAWDEADTPTAWSETATWTMSLQSAAEWRAQWIGLDVDYSEQPTLEWGNSMPSDGEYKRHPARYFKRVFNLDEIPDQALAHISAMGIYEVYINGARLGEAYFTPGWPEYGQRLFYNTFDLTPLLKKGDNVIVAVLADGWYAGCVATKGQGFYGQQPWLSAQFHLTNGDGSQTMVFTDSSWKARLGPIREADILAGETYDARMEIPDLHSATWDSTGWQEVEVLDTAPKVLSAYASPLLQRQRERIPEQIDAKGAGRFIVDFGQNFSGWVRLRVKGNRGDSVVIRYAERLKEDGELFTYNLRSARATDTYVLKGVGEEVFEPRFTYHGFQFVEVSGLREDLEPESIKGIVAHSDLDSAGSFACSAPIINQLFSNILWSQRSNFFEIPTDCPQRDERLGWLGDAQLFLPTAAYNMDVAKFYEQWLQSVFDSQNERGQIQSNVPLVHKRVAAGWGDGAIIIPYELFRIYGDTLLLRKYYSQMCAWVDYLEDRSQNGLSTQGSYGDWQNVESETPRTLFATPYFKHCLDIISNIAAILGNDADAERYAMLAAQVKHAFADSFLLDSARLNPETQTAYALALAFDLIPKEMRALHVQHLVRLIESKGGNLSTGIHGTRFLLDVLAENGQLPLAYKLLQNTAYPSWGFQIEQGANTIWERWDGYSKEAGFHTDSTNSFNHFALGSVGEWLYSNIAGIKNGGNAYQSVLIDPKIGGGLSFAKASYMSLRGKISTHWKREEEALELEVSIPANTTATVCMPCSALNQVSESGKSLLDAEGVLWSEEKDKRVVIQISSGNYSFRCSELEEGL